MKAVLEALLSGEVLTKEAAQSALASIAKGESNGAQVAAFLTAYRMRDVTAQELCGFEEAMRSVATTVDLSDFDPVDVCGTGGDGKHTFNISTAAAFLLAACGVAVAKHGNHGVSSSCGSSTILEALGVDLSQRGDLVRRQIKEAGICYFHAPHFHPAMKNIAPIRKELGFKTFFNYLGPLVNPARPQSQLIGVSDESIIPLIAEVARSTARNFWIVRSLDGYDEISLTAPTVVQTPDEVLKLVPQDFGTLPIRPDEITGAENLIDGAKQFESILRGTGTEAQSAVVCANVALVLHMRGVKNIREGFSYAKELLHQGRAWEKFELFRRISRDA